MIIQPESLYGRLVTWPKVVAQPVKNCEILPTFKGNICQRCGCRNLERLPRQQFYCRQCLALGRVSSLDHFLTLPEPNHFNQKHTLTWTGTLTPQQNEVSQVLVQKLKQQQNHLVWAVTGAGKTEMLFPLLHTALNAHLRIGIVSPRVDVIVELAPRLEQAFSKSAMVVLHGQQPLPYRYTQLVLATTHQLLRFYRAFDLLIIDEVDSFPFAGDRMLAYAVEQASKIDRTQIYLTATPTPQLQRQVKRKKLSVSYLPLRFHQHLLPQITVRYVGDWRKKKRQPTVPPTLHQQLSRYYQSGQRFLLFVPKIKDLAPLLDIIRQHWPDMLGESVYAGDPKRQEKVQMMRDKRIQYLITTTILERGVTLPGIDVLILGADDPIFSENALVQIAGRVGRSHERPSGLVCAYVTYKTQALRLAQRQIKKMNQLGNVLRQNNDE